MALGDWTATILSKTQAGRQQRATVQLVNSATLVELAQSFDYSDLADLASQIRGFLAVDVGDVIDLTPPKVVPPDAAKAAYLALVQKLAVVQANFDAQVKSGALKPDDAGALQAIADLQAAIKAAFDPAFLS